MSLVKRISSICEQNGLTLTSLERLCGFGVSSIRKWDDHAPTLPKLQKVADTLGVTVGYILGETEKPALDEDELNAGLIDRLVRLTPQELALVDAYVQGLLALREGPPSPDR